jgi:hypothetical protein
MYIDLIRSAAEVQKTASTSVNASSGDGFVGLYYLTLTDLTARFFQEINPPEEYEKLHNAFIEFLLSCQTAFVDEVAGNSKTEPESKKRFMRASKYFVTEMELLNPSESSRAG